MQPRFSTVVISTKIDFWLGIHEKGGEFELSLCSVNEETGDVVVDSDFFDVVNGYIDLLNDPIVSKVCDFENKGTSESFRKKLLDAAKRIQ